MKMYSHLDPIRHTKYNYLCIEKCLKLKTILMIYGYISNLHKIKICTCHNGSNVENDRLLLASKYLGNLIIRAFLLDNLK